MITGIVLFFSLNSDNVPIKECDVFSKGQFSTKACAVFPRAIITFGLYKFICFIMLFLQLEISISVASRLGVLHIIVHR